MGIRSKKSNFTCTLELDQPPSDQKNQKKIKFHLYTRARSTPIRSKQIKKIKKKSNFTCTLEHDQPPSDQNRSKKSNFTCTLEHDQPPSDQKIRSKPIKKIKKKSK